MSRDYLVHHGILGQKWGVRRYQNKDGTLTAEGRRRLSQQLRDSDAKRNSKDWYTRSVYSGDSQVRKAIKSNKERYEELKRLSDDYDNYTRETEKAISKQSKIEAQKAAEKAYNDWGKDDDRELTKEEWKEWFLEEEFEPSDNRDRAINALGLQEYDRISSDKAREYYKAVREYANELLGEYGNVQMPTVEAIARTETGGFRNVYSSAARELVSEINLDIRKNRYGLY